MASSKPPKLVSLTIDDLRIDDEPSFKHVGLYGDLKRVLERAKYVFRTLPEQDRGRWDRALLLNLTYWGANGGGDVLTERRIDADVVAHVAWHHLAAKALGTEGAPLSAEALFFGEAIASAFDVYLVGRLIGHAPDSSFLETQVPAMAEAADAAGLPEAKFDALLAHIADDPDRAFEDLRSLLFDASGARLGAKDADEGLAALATFDTHTFAPLLHRYELSNWVLYARAYANHALGSDERVREFDAALRSAPVALDWLEGNWVTPALKR